MNNEYQHRITLVASDKFKPIDGVIEFTFASNMQAAIKNILAIAELLRCDIKHYCYNSGLLRWEYLGVYHENKTKTDSFGAELRYVGKLGSNWEQISKGGEK